MFSLWHSVGHFAASPRAGTPTNRGAAYVTPDLLLRRVEGHDVDTVEIVLRGAFNVRTRWGRLAMSAITMRGWRCRHRPGN